LLLPPGGGQSTLVVFANSSNVLVLTNTRVVLQVPSNYSGWTLTEATVATAASTASKQVSILIP
jgi:hypothetical protein